MTIGHRVLRCQIEDGARPSRPRHTEVSNPNARSTRGRYTGGITECCSKTDEGVRRNRDRNRRGGSGAFHRGNSFNPLTHASCRHCSRGGRSIGDAGLVPPVTLRGGGIRGILRFMLPRSPVEPRTSSDVWRLVLLSGLRVAAAGSALLLFGLHQTASEGTRSGNGVLPRHSGLAFDVWEPYSTVDGVET